MREKAVLLKHFVIRSEVKGRRVVLIDDSIVRGTTSRHLVSLLRDAGAKEVHIRVCSPPVRFPCYFGIDTPHRKDLISNAGSAADLCKSLGADTLAFISVKGLLESLERPEGAGKKNGSGNSAGPGGESAESADSGRRLADESFCLGCFTGEYPIPTPGETGSGNSAFQKTLNKNT
jgi:amidophosphoribosyltransferase